MAVPLCNADDVVALLGRSDEPDLLGQAQEAVLTVSEQIRAYVGSRVLAGTAVYELEGTWSCRLILGERPITAVHSVVLDGITLDPSDYQWFRRGHLHRRQGWGGPGVRLVVSFDYGYDDVAIPDGLREVCRTAAARLTTNSSQLKLERAGTYIAETDFSGGGFTNGELIILDRYRRRTWP